MDDNVLAHIVQTRQDIGEIKAGIQNLTSYVGAVNKKVDDVGKDLSEHKLDAEAHGEKVKKEGSNRFIAWAMLGLSAVEIAHIFLK